MLKTMFTRQFARRFAAVVRDRRGVVLPETAILMPVLITMMLAGYDVARFALLQQKLSRVAVTTSDMVAQGETISVPQIDIIFTATSTMVQPFAAGASQRVIVSSVSAVGAAPPKLDWQRTGGGTLTGVTSKIGTVVNANVTLPTGFLVRDGENAIIAEVYYDFKPTFMPVLVPPNVLYHRAIFRPRVGSLSVLCVPPNPC